MTKEKQRSNMKKVLYMTAKHLNFLQFLFLNAYKKLEMENKGIKVNKECLRFSKKTNFPLKFCRIEREVFN